MKNKHISTWIVIFLCAISITQTASAIRMYEIIDLCPNESNPDIHVEAINDHGQVVGTHNCRAFVWDIENGFKYLSEDDRSAWDINNNGDILVSKWIDPDNQPSCSMYNHTGLRDVYLDIFDSSGESEPVGGAMQTGPNEYTDFYYRINYPYIGVGLNDYLDCVWFTLFAFENHPSINPIEKAYFWNGGDFITQLPGPEGEWVPTKAYDINNSKQIAGNYGTMHEGIWGGFSRASVWNFNGEGFECSELETPEGEDSYSNAWAINEYGEVAGFVGRLGASSENIIDRGVRNGAFWDSQGRLIEFGSLGGNFAEAVALNGSREVVGWSYRYPSWIVSNLEVKQAFIWTEQTGMLALDNFFDNDDVCISLHEAVDINESGQIVGTGMRPDSNLSAFLIHPVGEKIGISEISIIGVHRFPAGRVQKYRVEAFFENGMTISLDNGVEWSVESDIATIDQDGVLSTSPTRDSHTVTIVAKYADGDVLLETSKTIIVRGPKKLLVPSEYSTIQEGIFEALDGDTVLVADGVYSGVGNRDMAFEGKAITVRSENGPDNCIIECGGTAQDPHRGITFQQNESVDSVLDGFTIRGGYLNSDTRFISSIDGRFAIIPADKRAAGILCVSASPTIRNCIISNNVVDKSEDLVILSLASSEGGGGIYLDNSDAIIESCTLLDNYSIYGGGGICVVGGSDPNIAPLIRNCTISRNRSSNGGGIWASGSVDIENCIISGNHANNGGGIYCSGGTRIAHSVIVGNSADEIGGGIYSKYGYLGVRFEDLDIDLKDEEHCVKLVNSIIRQNHAPEGVQLAFEGIHYGLLLPTRSLLANTSVVPIKSISASELIERRIMPIPDNLRATTRLIPIPDDDLKAMIAELMNRINIMPGGMKKIFTVYYMMMLEVRGCDIEGGRSGVWFREYDEDIEIDWDRVFVWGDGNIDVDPGFVADGYWDDCQTVDDPNDDFWVDGDYRLLPGSVCIDAGVECDLNSDIAGNARPFDFPMVDNGGAGESDIGAYEAVVSKKVSLRMIPGAINRQSRRREMMALISGAGTVMDDVGLLLLPSRIESRGVYSVKASRRGDNKHLFAFFDGAKLLDSIDTNGKVELGIVGITDSGEYFYGSDKIQITGRNNTSRQPSIINRRSKTRGRKR